MGNSFQEQFLKAGLVDKNKVKRAKAEKHKKQKQKQKQPKGAAPVDENRLRLEKEQAEKAERDRQLNQQRKKEAEKKAIAAQIKQIIEMNRQPLEGGDVAYNFSDHNKIKTLYVTELIQEKISCGVFAVVRYDETYAVVAKPVAEKIAQRDPTVIVLLNDKKEGEQQHDDDPYSAFQVPDDLMW